MNVHDYLIAIYFIVTYVCLLTVVIAAAFAIFVYLQRREINKLAGRIAALEERISARHDQA